MKTWKLEMLAAAISLAMATTAGAQSTNSRTMPADVTTPAGSTMHSETPKECANLTGRAMSDCVRDHNPSSTRSKSGTNSSANGGANSTGMNSADTDARRGTKGAVRNDKSGTGAGSTGTSSSAGTTGTAGAGGAAGAGTGSGSTGSTGTAGSGTGSTGGAAGGAAGGGTSGDTGGAGAGGGGGGK